jgi:hypothetical protein
MLMLSLDAETAARLMRQLNQEEIEMLTIEIPAYEESLDHRRCRDGGVLPHDHSAGDKVRES